MLDAGLCKHVVIVYGHSGLSGGGMQLLASQLTDDAAFGHFGPVAGYATGCKESACTFSGPGRKHGNTSQWDNASGLT